MKKIIDKIKMSDVGIFGVLALATGAFAMLSANVPSLISPKVSTFLHSNIYNGASLENMQAQIARLQNSNAKMAQEYKRMSAMIKLAQQDQGNVVKRVGAMESSLPLLLEAIPPGTQIDNSISTASIDNESTKVEAEGGYAIISNSAIEATDTPAPIQEIPKEIITQKTPEPIKKPEIIANGAFGISLGDGIKITDAVVSFKDLELKIGPLLLGLEPILSVKDKNEMQKLIAGPIEDYSQAEQLCNRIIRVGISCLPVPYEGEKMPK